MLLLKILRLTYSNAMKKTTEAKNHILEIEKNGISATEKAEHSKAISAYKSAKEREEFYKKEYENSQKTLDSMGKDYDSYLKEGTSKLDSTLKQMDALVEENADAMMNATQEKHESIKAYFIEQAEAAVEAVNLTTNTLSQIYDWQMSQMEKRHEKERTMISETAKHSVAMARDNIYKQAIIQRHWMIEQKKLAERQLVEEKKIREKQKTMDIVSALINTGVAVTKTFANVGAPAGFILGALQLAAGLSQVAMISSQNYRRGGEIVGNGGSTSDSVPINASNGEYMLSADNVASLGGVQRIEQMLDERIDTTSGNNGSYTLVVENFIGNEEYERGLFERFKKGELRW